MGYYRGDGNNYYRGDYYRGDPFLGGLIAGAAGKLVKKAAGWVGSRIGRAAGSSTTRQVMEQLPAVGVGMGIEQVRRGLAPSMPSLGPISMGPSSGGGGGSMGWGEKKKYRRMNPLNPRALKRALRRAEGFEKFARRTVSALRTGPKKFKSTKRRSA